MRAGDFMLARYFARNPDAVRQIIEQQHRLFRRLLEELNHSGVEILQNPWDMASLALLVRMVRPKTIVEIGSGSRASTLALASSAAGLNNGCRLLGIDILPHRSFTALCSGAFPDLPCCPVNDVQMDARLFEIDGDLANPVLMFYDVHDVPGEPPISQHAINRWFPRLSGETVAVHDCIPARADFPRALHGEKVLADDRMFGFLARHFSGKNFVGYAEMPVLIEYLNDRQQDILLATDDWRAMGYPDASTSVSYFRCSAVEVLG